MWQVNMAIGIVLGAFVLFIFYGLYYIIRDIRSGNFKNRPQVLKIWNSFPYVLIIFLLGLFATLITALATIFGIIILVSEPSTIKSIIFPLTMLVFWVIAGSIWYVSFHIYYEYRNHRNAK